VFTDGDAAEAYLRSARAPRRVVLKASGLAAGKGVVIPPAGDVEGAVKTARWMLSGEAFGDAGRVVVVEEYLEGVEASVLALCDGERVVALPAAQDHKRVWEFDEGPNTGGMGVYAPAPAVTRAVQREVMERVLLPAARGMKAEGRPFVGVLFAGLMIAPEHSDDADSGQKKGGGKEGRVRVLEFNVRFGDPETEALMPLLHSSVDLLQLLEACSQGRLGEVATAGSFLPTVEGAASACVVACSAGYPGTVAKGLPILIADQPKRRVPHSVLFHAGTTTNASGALVTNGGRVIVAAATGASLEGAVARAYAALGNVSFSGAFFRRDIGNRWTRPQFAGVGGVGVEGSSGSSASSSSSSSSPSSSSSSSASGRLRVAVLGSTRGSDLGYIFEAMDRGELRGAEVSVVISNVASAGILEKARARGVPAVFIPLAKDEAGKKKTREEYDTEVVRELEAREVDLVLLVGFMRIVSKVLCGRYKWRLLNVHPSLLPEFAGGMDLDVHKLVLEARRTRTGCSVHYVTEAVDGGDVLFQRACAIDPDRDTPDDVKRRVQRLEGEALVDAVRLYVEDDRRGFLSAVRRHGFHSLAVARILLDFGAQGIVLPRSFADADPSIVRAIHALHAARQAKRWPPGELGSGEKGSAEKASGEKGSASASSSSTSSSASSALGVLTYADAGVDVVEGDKVVDLIGPLCRSTRRAGTDAELGGFGALFDLRATGFADPLLVSGTDGVGTKLLLAIAAGNHAGVGIDLVAMCVNDILAQGAEPLFFLDYFATGKLQAEAAAAVVASIVEGCKRAGCALVGGETAEMAGFYKPGEYDLAGFAVGAVERGAVLPAVDRIRPGDVILGLASSGVHSNGFSLVRRILDVRGCDLFGPAPFGPGIEAVGGEDGVREFRPRLVDVLLEPTRIYVPSVLPLLQSPAAKEGRGVVKGVAHITGSGLVGNVGRALPAWAQARIDALAWDVPPLFRWLQGADSDSRVPDDDMALTFNLGIGLVLIVAPEDAEFVTREVEARGERVFPIGVVEKKPTRDAPEVVLLHLHEALHP
jgi:formyltetrahydrofolate-dependent phosphoribosylglycinamide formyltransferase